MTPKQVWKYIRQQERRALKRSIMFDVKYKAQQHTINQRCIIFYECQIWGELEALSDDMNATARRRLFNLFNDFENTGENRSKAFANLTRNARIEAQAEGFKLP